MTTDHEHTVDNQGLCHVCGVLLDEATWDVYTGRSRPYWVHTAVCIILNPLMALTTDFHDCVRECTLRGITAAELLAHLRRRAKNA